MASWLVAKLPGGEMTGYQYDTSKFSDYRETLRNVFEHPVVELKLFLVARLNFKVRVRLYFLTD